MSETTTNPLVARRALAAELRRLRDAVGMTAQDVGSELGCHNSKISRIETGKRACGPKDFRALMELYSVEESKLAALTELMLKARQRTPPWWQVYDDVISANYAEFISFEAEAITCRQYETVLLPAYLQTEDYARAVTAVGFAALGPDQVDSLVEVRMRRQQLVTEAAALRFECLFTEAALHFQVGGPTVQRAQLRRIQELADLPNISIRIIPYQAGAGGTMKGTFTIFGFPGDEEPDAAFTESVGGTLLTDDARGLRRLNRLFANLAAVALSEEESTELVARIEKELTRDAP